jgi:DNA-binding LacI/PurR family transcriptional regulator
MKNAKNGTKRAETLQDIAVLAGVSPSTVSRALQGSSLISDETRERVQAIAEEHGYRPNLLGRNLRLKRTNTVAFVIPVDHKEVDYLSDPFLLKFIGVVNVALRERDYDMLITQPLGHHADVVEQYVNAGRADGLILMGRSTGNHRLLANAHRRTPVVLWGPNLPGEAFCSVGIDNVAAAQEATDHLLQQGRRRVAFIGMQAGCLESMQRYKGYVRALQHAGRRLDDALVVPGDYSGRSGYEGTKELLAREERLDAVFANSDVLALGAMEALREAGRRVPEDVAVVGFDNIPQGAYVSPPLTTVSQNLTGEGAELLVEKLLQQIKGHQAEGAVVPHRLVVRGSSGVETP